MATIDQLAKSDQAHPMDFMPRVSRKRKDGAVEYSLRPDEHLQGCEVITTGALAGATDPLVRRFAEAHLWRFAGRRPGPDGGFPVERYGEGMSPAGLLEIFARHDHPASMVAIMRSIPWVIGAQNPDGSWGDGPIAGRSTLAVLEALARVEHLLPAGFVA
jgi:hypothetical protein